MEQFSLQNFLVAAPHAISELCDRLSTYLHGRIAAEPDFHDAVKRIVEELRAVGHDLWSFDESDDMESWGPNYANAKHQRTGGLVVYFETRRVLVEWSEAK